jgi:hypothetical protein
MLARIISLVLIAAVIACPLSCGHGVCCVSQCCADAAMVSAEQSSHAACLLQAITSCGCCDESCPRDDQRNPHPSPGKSSCQGVCGGAVFEKPCELKIVEVEFVLPLTGADSTFVFLLSVDPADRFDFPDCVRAGNQGRFVRTLHMSLNC